MGGGSSKINAGEGVVVPVKIRPLLLSRFEEFRKRRNRGTLKIEGTLSRKKLLKDGHEEEDGNSQYPHENEKERQDKNKEKEQAKDEIMVVRVISIEKMSRVVPLPNSECECETEEAEKEEDRDTNIEQDNQGKVFHVDDVVEEHEEENTRENEEEVHPKSDDEDDDDDKNEERGKLVYPKSPSFRIYCIETESKKDEQERSKNETIAVHKKSASANSIQNAASRNSNEIVEIESTQKRKGNKMKKFGAVWTLLKVKSCYHPMSSCTGNNRTHVLVAKMN
ncbi:PREDICTED: nucleoplasmin-like protein ANO39 isoform X2 [Lupinus angustifolius]|uniref:nucleoplasmin-like protein ANO39 isoform X2 n=1 Tax=Lupinus angustifolius TaxID=3871 RepID=UPI00092F9443|nr:PREDICTED: nucleoplasmin-like protein ANO39 isoform X2 [Lupinus angustifolius]